MITQALAVIVTQGMYTLTVGIGVWRLGVPLHVCCSRTVAVDTGVFLGSRSLRTAGVHSTDGGWLLQRDTSALVCLPLLVACRVLFSHRCLVMDMKCLHLVRPCLPSHGAANFLSLQPPSWSSSCPCLSVLLQATASAPTVAAARVVETATVVPGASSAASAVAAVTQWANESGHAPTILSAVGVLAVGLVLLLLRGTSRSSAVRR